MMSGKFLSALVSMPNYKSPNSSYSSTVPVRKKVKNVS